MSSKVHVFFTFHAISNIKKKLCTKKIKNRIQTKYIEKWPFTDWLTWEVVSPNSSLGQLESMSIYISYSLFVVKQWYFTFQVLFAFYAFYF